MRTNENAPRRSRTPYGRQTETIAAEQLIPQLNCIMDAGGIQVSRHRPYPEKMRLYALAKNEFCALQSQNLAPCRYDVFIAAITEALRI